MSEKIYLPSSVPCHCRRRSEGDSLSSRQAVRPRSVVACDDDDNEAPLQYYRDLALLLLLNVAIGVASSLRCVVSALRRRCVASSLRCVVAAAAGLLILLGC